MLDGIVFDLDGVLVKPESSPKRDCERQALREFGVKISDSEFKEYKGLSPSEKIREIINSSETQVDPEKVIERKLELHLEALESIESVPGSCKTARELSPNFELSIASNSERAVVERAVQNLGLEDVFNVLVSSDDVSKGKPDPEIFLAASKKIGVEPKNTVVIDDSEVGVEGAEKGGFISVGFQMEEDKSKASRTVENMGEFKDLVRRLNKDED